MDHDTGRSRSADAENETAARVSTTDDRSNERALAGSLNSNVYTGRTVRPSLYLRPIWNDQHHFCGWLRATEAAFLDGERR